MIKIKRLLLSLGLASFLLIAPSVTAAAAPAPCDLNNPPVTTSTGDPVLCTCPSGYAHPLDINGKQIDNVCSAKALGNGCSGNTEQTCLQKNSLVHSLNNIINFLAAGVGVVVTGVIILGGIQYTLAGGDSNKVAAARQRIINGLIALVVFLFMYAFLQWLVPGGVFG